MASDCLIVVVCVAAGQLLRFGAERTPISGPGGVSYTTLSAVLVVGWVAALAMSGAWHPKIFLSGTPGYGRIIRASFAVFGLLAIVAYLGKWDIARGYVAIAIPLGLVALLVARASWRAVLMRLRRRGQLMSRTLVVGGIASAGRLVRQFADSPQAGYDVIGMCLPPGHRGALVEGVPVVGSFDGIVDAARRLGASVIAVARTDTFGPEALRKLSWALERTDLQLVAAPMLTDITGPRIHVEPVPGMELVHMERPKLSGPQLWLKTAFDYVAAAVGLVLVSPVFLAVAIAIKLDDGGPVFFRQQRVGLGERPFRIWKFRSMVVDAEARLGAERARAGQSETLFFKAANDSRVTGVGRFIRKTSVDELPQLLNVLAGDMSLVGPRPLAPGEGGTVGGYVSRRALVKPGMTGLWQVSGRSDIDGDQRASLDLLYVERWSLFGDLSIILRTLRTVSGNQGAV